MNSNSNWYKLAQYSVEKYEAHPIPATTDRGEDISRTEKIKPSLPDNPTTAPPDPPENKKHTKKYKNKHTKKQKQKQEQPIEIKPPFMRSMPYPSYPS